jgi:hypothetical protein
MLFWVSWHSPIAVGVPSHFNRPQQPLPMPQLFFVQQLGNKQHQAKEYSEYQQYLHHGFPPHTITYDTIGKIYPQRLNFETLDVFLLSSSPLLTPYHVCQQR